MSNSPQAQEVKLLPCPFCGGGVCLIYQGSSDWLVECETCPVSASFWINAHIHGYGKGEHAEAIRRWNTRAPNDNQPPLAEKTPTTPQISIRPTDSGSSPSAEDLKSRIQNYIENGGFFNPEMMEHDKVRQLLLDIRDYFSAMSQQEKAK